MRSHLNTTMRGALACAKFDARALEKGIVVSVPVVEARYDRIADIDGRLLRVQVKYTSLQSQHASNSYRVHLQSFGHGKQTASCYTQDEVDIVVAYLAAEDQLAWLPAELFHGRGTITLRTAPAKNGQQQGIHLVETYAW